MMNATYAKPCQVLAYVKSATQSWLGRAATNWLSGLRFTTDCRAHFFTPEHTGQPHSLHQPRDGASGHAEAFPLQLTPDLANTIDAVVFVVHALYLHFQLVVTLLPQATLLRMLTLLLVPVICRRGDIQLMAYRSDSVTLAESTQQRHYFYMNASRLHSIHCSDIDG